MIKEIFNKQFWKYFGVTLGVLFLIASANAAFLKMEDFISSDAASGQIVAVVLLTAVAMLPILLICAISVAFALSFRRLGNGKLAKALAVGMVVVVPFASFVWLFDQYVQPQVVANSALTMWNMINRGEGQQMVVSDFLNTTASTSNPKHIEIAIDSLSREVADRTAVDGADDYYAQQAADKLHKYRFEIVKRRVNAVSLVVSCLIFALLGYASRKASVSKILSVAAIVIICVYIVGWIKGVMAIGD